MLNWKREAWRLVFRSRLRPEKISEKQNFFFSPMWNMGKAVLPVDSFENESSLDHCCFCCCFTAIEWSDFNSEWYENDMISEIAFLNLFRNYNRIWNPHFLFFISCSLSSTSFRVYTIDDDVAGKKKSDPPRFDDSQLSIILENPTQAVQWGRRTPHQEFWRDVEEWIVDQNSLLCSMAGHRHEIEGGHFNHRHLFIASEVMKKGRFINEIGRLIIFLVRRVPTYAKYALLFCAF